MTKPGKASGSQSSLTGFGQGSVVSLDGGKRLRMDDKVDFWPATGAWQACETEDCGVGMTSLLAFLTAERARAGVPVPEPVAHESRRVVTCQYCKQPAALTDGREVFPHRPDLHEKFFWACWACDAWVGCHSEGDTTRPMGSLANAELREARRRAHAAFDPLWRNGEMSRLAAYQWLSKATGIPPLKCHIGKMNLAQCGWVVEAVAAKEQG